MGVIVAGAGDAAAGAGEVGSGGLATPIAVPVAVGATTLGGAMIVQGAAKAGAAISHAMSGEPRGSHSNGARPSTEGKHEKANARREREQTRAAEAKPNRGSTREQRQEAKKEYKKSESYIKPKPKKDE